MRIVIGMDRNGNFIHESGEYEVNLTDYEQKFYETLINCLKNDIDTSKISLEKSSNSYTSVHYGDSVASDFIRFKLTDRTKWMSLSIAQEDRKGNKNNVFFAAQKNKGQRHWKAQLISINDFLPHMDLIINSINEIIYLDSKEKEGK